MWTKIPWNCTTNTGSTITPNLIILPILGGDLAERVCKPWFELNETKCKQCVQQICRGLAFIHKNNIVHLDIKPFTLVFANMEENSPLKIVDFALAKR